MQFAGRPQDRLGLWGAIHPHLCCEARKGRGGRWRVESGYGPVMARVGHLQSIPARAPGSLHAWKAGEALLQMFAAGLCLAAWSPGSTTDSGHRPGTGDLGRTAPPPTYFTEGSSKVWEGRLQGHPAGVWPGRTGHQRWPLFGQRSLHPTRLESGGRGEYRMQEGKGVPSLVHTTIP